MPRISEIGRQTLEIVNEMQARKNRIEVVERLRPPDGELTGEQRAEFERVVACVPAEWFAPGNVVALVQYCRHVVAARRIGEAIELALSEGRGEALDGLLKAQTRETRMLLQAMTALRLTPRAVEPRSVSVKRLAQAPSPWAGWKRNKRQVRAG